MGRILPRQGSSVGVSGPTDMRCVRTALVSAFVTICKNMDASVVLWRPTLTVDTSPHLTLPTVFTVVFYVVVPHPIGFWGCLLQAIGH